MRKTLVLSCALGLATFFNLPAQAGLINGSFEDPDIGNGNIQYLPSIPGWKTTDSRFELWSDDAWGLGFKAYEGNQWAELNYVIAGTLYQDVSGIAAGSRVGFQFAHRARPGGSEYRVDKMSFALTDLGANGEFGDSDDTQLFYKEYSDSTLAWGFYTAATEVPIYALGHTVRFAYTAIDSYAPSFGNFLDAADFGVGVGLPAPDGAATLILLGTALAGLVAARRRV